MNTFCRGVDPGHRLRQLVIDPIVDRHRAKIRIFTVKTPLRRLIGMLEPVITDYIRLAEGCRNVALESPGAVELSSQPWPRPFGIRQARVVASE